MRQNKLFGALKQGSEALKELQKVVRVLADLLIGRHVRSGSWLGVHGEH